MALEETFCVFELLHMAFEETFYLFELLHMAFEETCCLFASSVPSHGDDFTPVQMKSGVSFILTVEFIASGDSGGLKTVGIQKGEQEIGYWCIKNIGVSADNQFRKVINPLPRDLSKDFKCSDEALLQTVTPDGSKFDPDNTGYISTEKFRSLLQRHGSELDPHKLEVLLALADSNSEGRICYQDFVNLMSNKRSNSFRQAILQGNRRLCSKALLEETGLSLSQRLIRHVAYETLPREIDRKWYYDSYTCCPPPWFMITITLVEASALPGTHPHGQRLCWDNRVAFFLYNGVVLDRFVLQVSHPLYLKNALLYHPQLRAQAWRYLTYIFMHAGCASPHKIQIDLIDVCDAMVINISVSVIEKGDEELEKRTTVVFPCCRIEHLGLNVVLQLLVGVPLEMVHGAARISFVYVAGVVAGSLAVSVADMRAPVVGSSGGVYALVSAHLANIVMNWSGMKCQFKLLRMAVALICMSFEFGRAVWLRFHPSAYPPCPHPSFMAHLGGVMVGITLGVIILRNYEQRLQDQTLWWIFLSIYVIFVLFAIFWNIFAYSLLDLKLPPPP
ncbi:Rhomboid-related protein 3 [Turdus rufiventris]|nr:Rhomboid-related protein 3 [Turdus rufiventris]